MCREKKKDLFMLQVRLFRQAQIQCYTEVKKIDLSLCAKGKDFGKGFYLTSDFSQAARFVKTAVAKAKKNGVIKEPVESGFVSSFRFNMKPDVSFFEFEEDSGFWMNGPDYIADEYRRELNQEQ